MSGPGAPPPAPFRCPVCGRGSAHPPGAIKGRLRVYGKGGAQVSVDLSCIHCVRRAMASAGDPPGPEREEPSDV